MACLDSNGFYPPFPLGQYFDASFRGEIRKARLKNVVISTKRERWIRWIRKIRGIRKIR